MSGNTPQKKNNDAAIVVIVIIIALVIGLGTYFIGTNQSRCRGLVGTWTIDGDMLGVYEFKANGSGGYGVGKYMLPFTYKDYGTYFSMSADEGKTWERVDYKISNFNSKLTITEDDGREVVFTCTE